MAKTTIVPTGKKVLVVDDEPDALELIIHNLKLAGFETVTADDGSKALRRAQSDSPDLILLDLMLPEMNGLEVCKRLRRDPQTRPIPIIMVTAKTSEMDRITGLELGADDYVTKPYSPRELVLRVKKLLEPREKAVGESAPVSAAGFTVDRSRHFAAYRGEQLTLTATEFKLLYALVSNKGAVLARDQLLKDVWGYTAIETRTVDTHMRRLRDKIGDGARQIDTVRSVGYRLLEAVHR